MDPELGYLDRSLWLPKSKIPLRALKRLLTVYTKDEPPETILVYRDAPHHLGVPRNYMGVEEAADAVLAFKPKQVYPYHYRTPEGFSNVAKFKELVNKGDPDIKVVQLEWYPK